MALLYSPNTILLTPRRQPELIMTSRGEIVPSYLYTTYATVEVDEDHHDNYFTQKQMTEWLRYRILDKWLYSDEMSDILKYLKVNGDSVNIVKTEKEMNENDIGKDTESIVDKKVKFIEDNYLTVSQMRALLIKIMEELGYRWYNLYSHEKVIIQACARLLRQIMKKNMSS